MCAPNEEGDFFKSIQQSYFHGPKLDPDPSVLHSKNSLMVPRKGSQTQSPWLGLCSYEVLMQTKLIQGDAG